MELHLASQDASLLLLSPGTFPEFAKASPGLLLPAAFLHLGSQAVSLLLLSWVFGYLFWSFPDSGRSRLTWYSHFVLSFSRQELNPCFLLLCPPLEPSYKSALASMILKVFFLNSSRQVEPLATSRLSSPCELSCKPALAFLDRQEIILISR